MRRTQRWLVLAILAVGTVAGMFRIWSPLNPRYSETHMDANRESAELMAPSVLVSKTISKPEPEYPWLAQAVESSGDVAVDVVIDESDKVISAKAVSGPLLLKRAS
jgi:hypothetical protein